MAGPAWLYGLPPLGAPLKGAFKGIPLRLSLRVPLRAFITGSFKAFLEGLIKGSFTGLY